MNKSLLETFYYEKYKYIAYKKFYKDKIFGIRKRLHDELYEKKKAWFVTMDILFVCAILFNIGALYITNILVVKNNPTVTFSEANPIQAAAHNFSYNPQLLDKYIGWIETLIVYSLLLVSYIFYRNYVFTELGMVALFLSIVMFTYGLGYDFFHDLFLLAGKWLVV